MPSRFRAQSLARARESSTTSLLHSSSPDPAAASAEPTAPPAPAGAAPARTGSDQAEAPAKPTLRSQDKTIHTIQGWRRWALWPLTTALQLWGASIRMDLESGAQEVLRDQPHATIFVMWHNRLFLMAELFRRFRQERPLYALISASRDGAWLTDFFAIVGIQAVRGSSSRRGREALTSLIEEIRAGHDLGITPDGPRGPCYEFKNGAVTVARRTRAPIALVGVAFESAWELGSWDRFIIPKPFSRTRVYVRLRAIPEGQSDEEINAYFSRELHAISPRIEQPNAQVI